ncbi:unnamed protein product [Toxocara canis]|uniref:Uncharacterized protein n=1 Tax=Toxocara canis TaxID=6265 RepID=A0A183UCZ9_TOXCA|nr:unnamed protein product [Toxocara canis]
MHGSERIMRTAKLRMDTLSNKLKSETNASKTPPSPAEAYAYKIRPPCAKGSSPPACVRVQKAANGRAPHRRVIHSAQCAHNLAHTSPFIELFHGTVTKFGERIPNCRIPHPHPQPVARGRRHHQRCSANGRAIAAEAAACAPSNGTCMFPASPAGNNKGVCETSPSSAASSPPLVAIPQPADSSPSKEAVRVRQPLLPVVSGTATHFSSTTPLPPPPPPPRAPTTCLTSQPPASYRCVPQREHQAPESKPEVVRPQEKFSPLPRPYFAQARILYNVFLASKYLPDASVPVSSFVQEPFHHTTVISR